MDVLDSLLKNFVNHFDFHYHWRCGKNKIIQLCFCFADDLLMFSKGDSQSARVLKIKK